MAQATTGKMNKIYDFDKHDSQYKLKKLLSTEENYLDTVQKDPNRQLSEESRRKFKGICLKFKEIITPRLGNYNGKYGVVDNSINFASVPAPNIKIHVPNYSQEMRQIMARKLDELEE